jgi:hypothetical protein
MDNSAKEAMPAWPALCTRFLVIEIISAMTLQ